MTLPPPPPGQREDRSHDDEAERVLAVWCPDWSVAAAGWLAHQPVLVLHANRVVAASAAARADGVVCGLRRREAQGCCPAAVVVAHDPARDARAFEPLVAALEALTPRIEVAGPGRCTFATRGPSRYFGGDHTLARRAGAVVAEAMSDAGLSSAVAVGVADGIFVATLAAAHAARVASDSTGTAGGRHVVAPEDGPGFLAGWPISELEPVLADGPALVDVWRRLGLRTLGDLAALPAADVLARFGPDGAVAHRLSRGLDARPLDARRPAPIYTVATELDPPAEQVTAVAFVAKALADQLHQRLEADGLACTRIVIVAETEHGERLERVWRHEGVLSAGAIADRARWQLDGWLSGSSAHRPTAGISRLVLAPDEVVAARGRQLGFWGGETQVEERAVRALARVQGLLGIEAVTVPEWRGGRGPADQVATVPAASVDLTVVRPAARATAVTRPWPGRVPVPAPAHVYQPARPAVVVDAQRHPVEVSGRGVISAAPVALSTDDGPWVMVTAWAGPWPVDERWWDPATHRRRARFQFVTADGIAHLVCREAGCWWLEATYD